jgi:hypothetical protein
MKSSMKNKNKKNYNTFTRNELFLCINKHKAGCPMFYASGYDNLIDFMNKQTNKSIIIKFLYDNREAINIIFVFFNPNTKLYYIETVETKSLISEWVQVHNTKEHLFDVVRFFNKTTKLEDVNDCQICFDELPHKYSESIFNMLTVTCTRCFNTICEKCHIKLQSEKCEYTCPFCKKTNKIGKNVKIQLFNKPDCLIDIKVYNEIILEMDTMSKTDSCNNVILNQYLHECVLRK